MKTISARRLIKPAAAISLAVLVSACVSTEHPDGKSYGFVQSVRSGVKTRGGDYATIRWDGHVCRAVLAEIAIVRPPLHGSMTIARGVGYVNAAQDGTRTACTGKYLPASVIYYQSKPGYRGDDRGVYSVRYPNGQRDLYVKTFQVH